MIRSSYESLSSLKRKQSSKTPFEPQQYHDEGRQKRSKHQDTSVKKNLKAKPEPDFAAETQFQRGIPFDGPKTACTISVAIPASIVDNVQVFNESTLRMILDALKLSKIQTSELRAHLVGGIARSLTIFGVDEVIIYEDCEKKIGRGGHSEALEFFVRNLQYLETPQYLRKHLFPMHPDLRFCGVQNPIDAPHHLRAHELLPYREGVVVDSSGCSSAPDKGCWVYCGWQKNIWITEELRAGTRVTLLLEPQRDAFFSSGKNAFSMKRREGYGGYATVSESDSNFKGVVISPSEARHAGYYWGYKVIPVKHFKDMFNACSFTEDGTYDLLIGTSERGESICQPDFKLPVFSHALIVFGGVKGLEEVLADAQSGAHNIKDPAELFNCYLNVCPFQRSRTIRTEEALLVTLSSLHTHILHQRLAQA